MAAGGSGNVLAPGAITPVPHEFWVTDRSVHVVRPDRRFTPHRVDVAIARIETFAHCVQAGEMLALERIRPGCQQWTSIKD